MEVFAALTILAASLSASLCENRPNFLVIMTDDQDVLLGGMTPMTNVKKYIQAEGVTFDNAYASTSVCCPSRASFLSGQYLHNHQTFNNTIAGGCFGTYWRENVEPNTFATIMQAGGYETFYAGKYLNRYGKDEAGGAAVVPPGWTHWQGMAGNSRYFKYNISNNGVQEYYETEYITDVLQKKSLDFLKTRDTESPFLMFITPTAPHGPFDPAPRHIGYYANISAVRTPTFNIKPTDKHWLMTLEPVPLPDSAVAYVDTVFRKRWETLLSVDEMFLDLYNEVNNQGVLDNTYIMFLSDHGYHMGQFSQVIDKRQPYETDIKIPFYIRGPGLRKNSTVYDPVLNIDFAPTLLTLAGFEVPEDIDGKVGGISLQLYEETNNKINKLGDLTWLIFYSTLCNTCEMLEIVHEMLSNLQMISIADMETRFFLLEYIGEYEETVSTDCPWAYDSGNLAFCVVAETCKCEDSGNNTYACVVELSQDRHIKYCQFYDDDDFVEIYDLKTDPHEQHNIAKVINPIVQEWYVLVMEWLQSCAGWDCNIWNGPSFPLEAGESLLAQDMLLA